jgi:peptidoglycan/xylan/chitin deacetylase (PgdA/CDA1 family)
MPKAASILIYHHVSTHMPASTSISPERFVAQLDYLAANHYQIVPLTDLAEKIRRGEALPDKTLAITFDDSYADVYTSAYPLLKQRGWPFTFFVNTEAVGQSKLFVSWEQLREMSSHGGTIANHTRFHHHLVRLNPGETRDQWRARTSAEITQAQQIIEQHIGFAPRLFAYPFGEYNSDLKQLLGELGYLAFTQQAGVLSASTQAQTLPRFAFGGSFTDLKDFSEKMRALPMPVKRVDYLSEAQEPLGDMQVLAGTRPYLVLTLADEALLGQVHCYGSNEGELSTVIREGKLLVQGKRPLPQGRSKFTCTAKSQVPGRFYWFTQLWLATDKDGRWNYAD